MTKKYALLYQLEITHAYYADGMSKDFVIQPSPATKMLMGKLDLHLVTSDNGANLFWGFEEQAGKKVSPFLLLDEPLVLTFLLVPRNPTFLNYTQLEILDENSNIYYYRNELSGSDHTELSAQSILFGGQSQEVTYTPPADATDAFNITFKNTGGAEIFIDSLTPQESQTGSYRVTWDVEDDWGKYTLAFAIGQIKKGSVDLYYLPAANIATTWGMVQLIVPPFNAASLPPEKAPSGRIAFTPRTTIWRYLIVNQSQLAFDELRLIRNGTVITGAPPTKQRTLPNGQPATVLTLPTALPLLHDNPEKIEVELLDTQGGSIPPKSVYKIQLPVPDAQRIYPEWEAGEIVVYSDLFVYL